MQSKLRLNYGELGGGNVEGVDVRSETGVCLLGTVGADEGVDLGALDVVHSLECLSDLTLVGPRISQSAYIFTPLSFANSSYLTLTMKTRVLFSSIFFMALSVLRG